MADPARSALAAREHRREARLLQARLHGPGRRRPGPAKRKLSTKEIFDQVFQNARVSQAELAGKQERQRVVPGEQGEDLGSPHGLQPVLEGERAALVVLLEGVEVG